MKIQNILNGMLESEIARQEKELQALAAGLQKVSNQLEVSKPAPRVVANDK